MTIISNKYNFIFVKTTKTAGTSIELELSKLVEDDAVVTPIVPVEPGHSPRNYSRGRFYKPYYNHMPASLIRRYLGSKTYFSKFSFCIERNPITKCISHYHMLANSPHHGADASRTLSWADYVDRGEFPIDVDKYVDIVDGRRQLIVNEVLAYEELPKELARIGLRIGLGAFQVDARAKSEYSRLKRVTPSDVTEVQRVVIMRAFAESLTYAGLDQYYGLNSAPALCTA